jgi:hypothetical protein
MNSWYKPSITGETVIVIVDGTWKTGQYTGESGDHGETFKLKFSPFAGEKIDYFHYEDMREFTKENIEEYISPE